MYFTIEFYENKHFDLSMIDVLTFDCQMLTADTLQLELLLFFP